MQIQFRVVQFEDGLAVLEQQGQLCHVPITWLPDGTQRGDTVIAFSLAHNHKQKHLRLSLLPRKDNHAINHSLPLAA